MKKRKEIWILISVIMLVLIGLATWWILYLKKAHSTFENYYAFRGCTELLAKTDDYGICKLKDGKEIRIVKFDNRWFLDGDLPGGFLSW